MRIIGSLLVSPHVDRLFEFRVKCETKSECIISTDMVLLSQGQVQLDVSKDLTTWVINLLLYSPKLKGLQNLFVC